MWKYTCTANTIMGTHGSENVWQWNALFYSEDIYNYNSYVLLWCDVYIPLWTMAYSSTQRKNLRHLFVKMQLQMARWGGFSQQQSTYVKKHQEHSELSMHQSAVYIWFHSLWQSSSRWLTFPKLEEHLPLVLQLNPVSSSIKRITIRKAEESNNMLGHTMKLKPPLLCLWKV